MSLFHDLGCSYAFSCVELIPRGRHTIKAVPHNAGTAVRINDVVVCIMTHRQDAFKVLEGFRAGMAYFGKKARRAF